MKRRVLTGVLVALTCLPATSSTTARVAVGEREPQPRLYGVTWQGSLGLARVEPDTLRPLGGRRVPLAREPLGWSLSPDRSRMVLGSTARGSELRFVDLRAMRALGDVTVARRGSGVATAWTGPRRVLAVVVTPGCCGAGDTIVAGIDAVRRRVIWRRTLGGSLQAGERLPHGLLLVLGPPGRSVGPSKLLEVDANGAIRSAPLPEIRSGSEPTGSVTRSFDPGLTVDRFGGRAFVVGAGAPVAEVDLATLGVRWHMLEPVARTADATAGPKRDALWLGRGLLAVTGSDRHRSGETPAGLTLIDTRDWRARKIDARTTDAVLVAGTLLASSFLAKRAGSGLTGYYLEGTRKFHIFGKEPIWGVQPIGRNALVGKPAGIALIDARSGRPLRRYRRFPMSLIAADPPVAY